MELSYSPETTVRFDAVTGEKYTKTDHWIKRGTDYVLLVAGSNMNDQEKQSFAIDVISSYNAVIRVLGPVTSKSIPMV